MKRKYDWDAIENLRDAGLTWPQVVEELGLDIGHKSLSKQHSQRRRRTGVIRERPRGNSDTPSLAEFAREKRMDVRRASCPICAHLDADVRQQLAEASAQGITRKEQMAWLEEVFGLRVTTHQLSAHFQGRHDD